MKLFSYTSNGKSKIGAYVEGWVVDVDAAFQMNLGGAYEGSRTPASLDMLSLLDQGEAGLAELGKALEAASEALSNDEGKKMEKKGVLTRVDEDRYLAPIPRPRKNIVCLGLNYADHVAEGGKDDEEPRPLPEHPIYFTKPPTAVTGPYSDIVYPKATERLDYEVELAIVIGKEGKYIEKREVFDHIAGYTVFNDVSARDLQSRHHQWFKGKSCDTFAPMGPFLVTPDEVGDPMNLDIWLDVNGETRQSSNTSHLIFDIPTLVSTLSTGITLEVGDIIATGTPSGVGAAHPLGLLKLGDVVETCIEKVGVMRNKVVAE